MAYSFQTFIFKAVLTSAQMNQVEVNIRDHVHGTSGVTPALNQPVLSKTVEASLPASASEGKLIWLDDGPQGLIADFGTKLAHLFGYNWVADAYTSLNSVITALGATQATLIIQKNTITTASVTCPSTLTLRFEGQGMLSPATGHIVTISGRIESPQRKIFNCVGVENCIVGLAISSPNLFGADIGATASVNRIAINQAIQSVVSKGLLTMIPGKYLIDATTILFDAPINASLKGVLLDYGVNTGTAVLIGKSAGAETADIDIDGLEVERTYSIGGNTTAAQLQGNGIVISNLKSGELRNLKVEGFAIGLRVFGDNNGVSYVQVYNHLLVNNQVSIKFDVVGTGWTNENQFFSGRALLSTGFSSYVGSKFIQMTDVGINGNSFYSMTIESTNVERKLDILGTSNYFHYMRWEGVNGGTDIEFKATSQDNVIFYGNELRNQVVLDSGGTNHIYDINEVLISGSSASTFKGILDVQNTTSSANPAISVREAGGGRSFNITGRGDLQWGAVDAVPDVILHRIGVNSLKLEDAFINNSPITLPSGNATPSINGGNIFITAGTTTITNFQFGAIGTVIRIKATAAITIASNVNIDLSGGVNYAMTDKDTLTLTMFVTNVWVETSRSVN